MKVIVGAAAPVEIGTTEANPTIGIIDFSRRSTDDFGVTTVVERGFARRMSVRVALPFEEVDGLQRLLANLRTTAAQWVADEGFDWLQPTGFYKDFQVDLNVPPLSFCTLTVEGLAENESSPDAGEDPAPDGADSTLLMLRPLSVTDGVLASSTVPENDAPVWAAGTTYALGARVIRVSTHRVYESLVAGNIAHVPESSPGHWLDVGPTNRWAMFDEALGTVTAAAGGSIVVSFNTAAVQAVALLDVVGTTVQVEVLAAGNPVPVYDQTVATNGGTLTFLDLPAVTGTVRVTIAGPAPVSVGTLLLGELLGLGITEASPTAGITDFSRKEVDEFGAVTIVQRAWAKRMAARSLISSAALDIVADRIASVRARPVLWIGSAGSDSITAYGFFKEFSIEVGETLSKLSLSIEGLSKAEALKAPWADDIGALRAKIDRIASDGFLNAGEKPQAVIDHNALVSNYDALNGRYLALGSPADITPSRNEAATQVAALTAYLVGLAPAWNDPTQDTPIVAATYELRWVEAYEAVALFLAAVTGRTGAGGSPGLNNSPVFAYQRSAAGAPAAPSATATYDFAAKTLAGLNNGWSATIPAGTDPLYIIAATASSTTSSDTIASGEWAAPVLWTKDGAPGATGLSTANVYLYQRNNTGVAPAVPSVSSTWTFASATLSGHDNGWTQTVPDAAGGALLFVTTATALALATTPTDTIASGEWAVVRRMAKDGEPGANGLANAIVFAYQRSGSGAPALPSAATSYDFATKALTGLNNGWSAIPPAGTATMYITAATASSNTGTDSIAAGEWAAAQVWSGVGAPGDPGSPGLNTATVILLQRNNTGTAPAAPSVTTTWTFATGVLADINNGWSQAMPDPSAGQYLFWTQATALSTSPTDTIAAGEWTAPKRIVKDGDAGVSPVTAIANPSSKSLAANFDGSVKASVLPTEFAIVASQGGVGISGTVTLDGTPVGCTAEVITMGIRVTAASADNSSVKWIFTAPDGQQVKGTISLQKNRDTQPPTNLASAKSFSDTAWIGSPSYAASGPIAALTVGSSGKMQCNGYAEWYATLGGGGGGSYELTAKLQYRLNGGTWIDVSGSASTGEAFNVFEFPIQERNQGAVSPGGLLTGLAVGATFETQMVGVKNSGSSIEAGSMSGSVSVQQVA